MVSWGSRIFVTAVFAVLALAFVAETAVLAWEYREDGVWFPLAAFDAQNFLYFPIAGLAALFAFWRPGVVVVDAYMRGAVPLGRFLFIGGFALSLLAAWQIGQAFNTGGNRSFYEIAPEVLAADEGAPATAGTPALAPALEAIYGLRLQAQEVGLSNYRDSCRPNALRASPDRDTEKYCFVAGREMSVIDCCAGKAAFRDHVNALHATEESLTAKAHRVIMPMKIFFLLVLTAIGVMLVRRRRILHERYPDECHRFSSLVPVGAVLILAWPLMNGAYFSSVDILFGDAGTTGAYRTSAPLYTLIFGAWALLLLFYHLRSYPQNMEYAAQTAGIGAAAIGVVQYDALINYVNANLGVGASAVAIAVFVVGVLFIVWMFSQRDDEPSGASAASDGG